jgi:serine beta-lactamase-like protein LACTB, mitochondrial
MVIRLALFFLIVLPAVLAQVPPSSVAALERIATAAIQRARIPALSVSVSIGDGPAWNAAWGFADLENFVPARPETVFRLGSIAKPITAVAAMQLVEEGKLDLDAEVQRYVPSFPRKKWPVTVRQLLSHQGGIRNYQGGEFNSTRAYSSVLDSLAIFSPDNLLHEPGTRYAYTSYGFNLAGAAVEAAAAMPYAELIRRRIAVPSSAATLRLDELHAIVPYRARGYRKRPDGSHENCDLADTSNKQPGGGWIASAPDVVRFGRAVMDGRLLKPATLNQMWTAQPLKDGSPTGYGLGWSVARKENLLVASHSGTQQGIRAHLILVPEKRIAIAVLTNLEESDAPEIGKQMLDQLLGDKP